MNLVTDDDLRSLLAPLRNGVRFTMVSDCCHSGSMLDHPEQQIYGEKDPEEDEIFTEDMFLGATVQCLLKHALLRVPSNALFLCACIDPVQKNFVHILI